MNTLIAFTHIPDETPFPEALERITHLAIGAHQDDLEIFAYHGIATCFECTDQWFGGVTVTDGGGSARTGKYAACSDEEMKTVRNREQDAAADLGKYGFQCQLAYTSSEVKDSTKSRALVDRLEVLLRTCRPKVLYLHNPIDKHPTHLAVLSRCLEALRRLPVEERPEQVLGCEVWRDLDWLRDEDKVALPVDQHPELARGLIDLFESQIAGGKSYTQATIGRRHANATYFNSHSVDGFTGLTYAIDLNPLIEDDSLSMKAFVSGHIEQFKSDALSALEITPTHCPKS